MENEAFSGIWWRNFDSFASLGQIMAGLYSVDLGHPIAVTRTN